MCAVSTVTYSRLGLLFGATTVVLCLLSMLSGSWILVREGLRPADSINADHVTAFVNTRIGLFRTCLRVERVNATSPRESAAGVPQPCLIPPYSLYKELQSSELGLKGHLEYTPIIITRVRMMGVMSGIALMLMISGQVMGIIGHCKMQYKNATILCIYMYALAGLIQCMTVITVPFMLESTPRFDSRGRQLRNIKVISEAVAEGAPLGWEYGWSHCVAVLTHVCAHLCAFLMLSALVKRYPSMEAMVRDMVPGAARKLQEHQESNLVGMWEIYPSRAMRQIGCINLPVASGCYGKATSAGMATSKTKPDICSSNPESSVDSLQQLQQADSRDNAHDVVEQMRPMSPYDPTGSSSRSVTLGQPMSLSAPRSPRKQLAVQAVQAVQPAGPAPSAPAPPAAGAGAALTDSGSLAGVSVPITVMRTRPLGHTVHRSIPCSALEGTAEPSFAYGAQVAQGQVVPPPVDLMDPQPVPQDMAGTMTLQPRRKSGPGPGPVPGPPGPLVGAPAAFSTLDSRTRCANARAHTHTLPHPPRQF